VRQLPEAIQATAISVGYLSFVINSGTDWEADERTAEILALSNPNGAKSDSVLDGDAQLKWLYQNDVLLGASLHSEHISATIDFNKAVATLRQLNEKSADAGYSALMAHAYLNSLATDEQVGTKDSVNALAQADLSSSSSTDRIRITLRVGYGRSLIRHCGGGDGHGCWFEPEADDNQHPRSDRNGQSQIGEFAIQVGSYEVGLDSPANYSVHGRCVDDPHYGKPIKKGAFFCDYSNHESVREVFARWVPSKEFGRWEVSLPVGIVYYRNITHFKGTWEAYNPDAKSYHSPCMIGGDPGTFNQQNCSAAEVTSGFGWSVGLRIVRYFNEAKEGQSGAGVYVEYTCNGGPSKLRDSPGLGSGYGKPGQCKALVGFVYRID